MAITKLEKNFWHDFLARLSNLLNDERVEIDVKALLVDSMSKRLAKAAWLPLLSVAYDAANDVVAIAVDGIDRLVHQPHAIYVEHGVRGISALKVIDAQRFRHIVRLRKPLMAALLETNTNAGIELT